MIIKNEIHWLLIITAVTILVYANSFGGEFVYDDLRQIAGNVLIQDSGLVGKALTSDVWAFKSDGTVAASNYWRPTFTAWCILNFRLFGLDPQGWHVLNVILHIGVCLLSFMLLRKWEISGLIAFSITLIYAVHPIHSESVTWISGSPDLLFGLFFLSSLWFVEKAREKGRRNLNLGLAIVFYCLALGAKEAAFLCFPIYYLVFSRAGENADKTGSNKLNLTALFAVAALAWFFMRWVILGTLSQPAEDAAGAFSAILSAPAVFVFYLKQIVFPYWLGINYSLRPVEQAGLLNFIIPLAISIAALVLIWFLAKRSFIQKIGTVLFLLPLLLSFNIGAFPPEQIVHDRYLYLPLLGFLMLVVPALKELAERISAGKAEPIILVLAIIVSIPLAIQTYLYNRVWHDEIALWQNAVAVDEGSAINWSQLGSALAQSDRADDSVRAFDRSLAIRPTPLALLGKGSGLIQRGRFDEAAGELKKIVEVSPERVNAYTLFQGYEALAIALQGKQDLAGAEKLLLQARKRLPIYRAALTEKLAVILYLQNRKPDALKELEGVKAQARVEMLAASKAVFLRLGMLYAELGRKDEARSSLQEFLQFTKNTQSKLELDDRRQAEELLRQLR
jgi:tetratricopeptide (TPR) repeat protein